MLFQIRVESHNNFRAHCVIRTLAGGGAITDDVLKFRKVMEFQSLCICYSYNYLIIAEKRLSIKKVVKNLRN